jgi:lysophospholipase L1-like esterase
MKKLIAIAFATVSLAAAAANLVLVGDSTLAPRNDTSKLGSWGDALKPSLAEGNGIINHAIALYVGDTTRKGKPTFDTTHPSKAGAKRFAELFLAEVKARKLPVTTLFK